MNFFEAQDNARRKTWQLAALFVAAVVTLIILTNLLVILAVGWGGAQQGMNLSQSLAMVPIDGWLMVSGGVIGLVATASGYKYLTISAGGRAIAESLGGQLIRQSTDDLKQQRLLNVVEEMAIASGLPVPPVYLIPEPSINAFAAGFSADDAVIGINQGTLDLLERDELQGVVAHEFSHILNGDTGINLRLIAILHGILFLGMIGYGLLRIGGHSRRDGLPLLALGAGLMAIGYGGTFFGNLIKAAVSRQREYLADASAVQFTRNPDGIADALKKIGGATYGSNMTSEQAEQASHMFFGAASKRFATSLMATHPPLDERIRAIDPGWDGRFLHSSSVTSSAPGDVRTAGFAGAASPTATSATAAEQVVAQVGAPSGASLDRARTLIADNDDALLQAAHDPYEARALVYAMLIDEQAVDTQQAFIERHAEPGVPVHVHRLYPLLRRSDAIHRLTLLELAMPALKELSHNQYQRFSRNTAQLITSDGEVDVFEWVLHRLLVKELYPHFEGPQNYHGRIGDIHKLAPEAAKLLSILASQTHGNVDMQLAAFKAGAGELGLTQPFSKQHEFNYQQLNETLARLRKLKPLVKPALIKACLVTALHDHDLNEHEAALLQGIAATLDCPLPADIFTKTAAS